MSDVATEVQKAIRARLLSSGVVIALVPSAHILDSNERPAPTPSIVVGEHQVVDENSTIMRDFVRVFSTLHIWKKEPSLGGVREIAGAIRAAIGNIFPLSLGASSFRCIDTRCNGERFMRDPDGATSHGVLTVMSLVQVPT